MPNVPIRLKRDGRNEQGSVSPSTDRLFFDALANAVGENSILVAEDLSIVRVFGDITNYIGLSATSSLKMHLDLLRSPLREEARSLMTIAMRSGERRSGIRHVLGDTDTIGTRLEVIPIVANEINERAALLVFSIEMQEAPSTLDDIEDIDESIAHERIRTLENEVATTREALQQTIEELETSNEELQSLNEEMQSTNEELQAANEELETSNEELQSTNEELITVNEELQVTSTELSTRSRELTSVLESSPLPLVVVDSAFQILQATEAAAELFSLRRPIAAPHISQCALPQGFPLLAPLCGEAFQLGEDIVREFDSDGDWIRLTVSPYFDESGKILGVTIVVSEFPQLAREMETILGSETIRIMHRDRDGNILAISKASATTLGVSQQYALQKNLRDLMPEMEAQDIIDQDRAFLESDKKHSKLTMKVTRGDDEEPTWLSIDRIRFDGREGKEATVFFIGTDITENVHAQDEAKALVRRMEALQHFSGVGFWSVNLEDNTLHWSEEVFRIHRLSADEYEPELDSAIDFYHPEDRKSVEGFVGAAIEEGTGFQFTKRLLCNDEVVTVESHGVIVADEDGTAVRIDGFFRELESSVV